jgi:hypothetical protein
VRHAACTAAVTPVGCAIVWMNSKEAVGRGRGLAVETSSVEGSAMSGAPGRGRGLAVETSSVEGSAMSGAPGRGGGLAVETSSVEGSAMSGAPYEAVQCVMHVSLSYFRGGVL